MNKATINILKDVQKLVSDIQTIERSHNTLGTSERENVIEHSFAVAMLCWRTFDSIKPNLNLEKIFKYALAHDFLERGLKKDVNTYATDSERIAKKERKKIEFDKLCSDFIGFDSMLCSISDYEDMKDEESKFVWTVDKIQALILSELDSWRPHERENISYEDFYDKGEKFKERCPECLKNVLDEVITYTRSTYYDQPKRVL